MRIYDPCSGSGGMLILSKQYLDEHGGNRGTSALRPGVERRRLGDLQDEHAAHGIPDADIQNDDTLAAPQHTEGGELMRFDRVITNPPFSQNYERKDMHVPRAVPLRLVPGGRQEGRPHVRAAHARRAAARRDGGDGHAPRRAFPRRRREGHPQGLLDEDLLDAVIGLPPNLFYGTGIPACILVLRAQRARSPRRARARCSSSTPTPSSARAAPRTTCARAHREDRQRVHAFEDIDGYARVVSATS